MTFIPKEAYTKAELVSCAQGELFGLGAGRLPSDQMLMFDRILSISKNDDGSNKGQMIAELDINPELWFFDCHFKTDPVMPGCLGLDAMWQLVGFYLCWLQLPGKGRALGADKVKFFGQVLPDAKIVRYEIKMRRVINRGKLVMGIGNGNMFVDDRHVYSAENLRVGLFEDTSEF